MMLFPSYSQAGFNTMYDTPNQTRPIFVMDSLISVIKSCYAVADGWGSDNDEQNCYNINKFCNGLKGDEDTVKLICGFYYREKDDPFLEEIYKWANSVYLGAELIDGDRAIVHFTFEGSDGKRHNEYMNMLKDGDKWYLNSF